MEHLTEALDRQRAPQSFEAAFPSPESWKELSGVRRFTWEPVELEDSDT